MGKIEETTIWSGPQVDSLLCCAKCMPQEESKEDPKESWGEYTALFDSAAHIEGLREVAIELHSPLHVGVEGLN